jgi:hypothetical protein
MAQKQSGARGDAPSANPFKSAKPLPSKRGKARIGSLRAALAVQAGRRPRGRPSALRKALAR